MDRKEEPKGQQIVVLANQSSWKKIIADITIDTVSVNLFIGRGKKEPQKMCSSGTRGYPDSQQKQEGFLTRPKELGGSYNFARREH